MSKQNEPKSTIRYGTIEAAIWENQGQDRPFYTVTLTRSYKAKDGSWAQTSSLAGSDLLVASQALEEAYRAIQDLQAAAPLHCRYAGTRASSPPRFYRTFLAGPSGPCVLEGRSTRIRSTTAKAL